MRLDSALCEVLNSSAPVAPVAPSLKSAQRYGVDAAVTLAAASQGQRALRRAMWMTALPSINKPVHTAFEVDRDNAPALQDSNDEAAKEKDVPMPPMWENLDGLPEVKVTSPAVAYFSKDIGSGEDGEMKPTFGCKCGGQDWRPAMSHPSISFRQEFIDLHPVNDNTQKTQWDATYDLLRFLKSGDVPTLTETTPAIPAGGKQLRFLTFCPEAAQNYTLKVTALDSNDEPIDYFQDDEMHLSATPAKPPPAPEEDDLLKFISPAKQAEKIAEQGVIKEHGMETGSTGEMLKES